MALANYFRETAYRRSGARRRRGSAMAPDRRGGRQGRSKRLLLRQKNSGFHLAEQRENSATEQENRDRQPPAQSHMRVGLRGCRVAAKVGQEPPNSAVHRLCPRRRRNPAPAVRVLAWVYNLPNKNGRFKSARLIREESTRGRRISSGEQRRGRSRLGLLPCRVSLHFRQKPFAQT